MADTPQTLALVLNALAQNFRPRVVRTFNARSTLLRTLPIVRGEGKNIAWDAEFNTATGALAEDFADGADAANFGSDDVQPATLSWGLYRSNFAITDLARAAARSSRTPDGLLRMVGRNFENSMRKLASHLNKEGFSGPGTGNRVTGLDISLADTGTLYGISRSTYSDWRSKVIDPGVATEIKIADLRSDISSIYDACGEVPDVAFCPTATWNKIAALFQELRRYNQATEITTARGQIRLDASVAAVELDGTTFIKDKDATAGRIYYVNSNYVRWEYLAQDDDGDQLPEQSGAMDIDDGYGQVPLGCKCYPLARTGAKRKATCQVFLNLVVEKPNTCGVRKNVAT